MGQVDQRGAQKLLLLLHNMGVVGPENAKGVNELASLAQEALEDVLKTLERFECEGYLKSVKDGDEARRYYLTAQGIIRVCSIFT